MSVVCCLRVVGAGGHPGSPQHQAQQLQQQQQAAASASQQQLRAGTPDSVSSVGSSASQSKLQPGYPGQTYQQPQQRPPQAQGQPRQGQGEPQGQPGAAQQYAQTGYSGQPQYAAQGTGNGWHHDVKLRSDYRKVLGVAHGKVWRMPVFLNQIKLRRSFM